MVLLGNKVAVVNGRAEGMGASHVRVLLATTSPFRARSVPCEFSRQLRETPSDRVEMKVPHVSQRSEPSPCEYGTVW